MPWQPRDDGLREMMRAVELDFVAPHRSAVTEAEARARGRACPPLLLPIEVSNSGPTAPRRRARRRPVAALQPPDEQSSQGQGQGQQQQQQQQQQRAAPQQPQQRIVQMHAAESLTFSTNEHVPFLICFEVCLLLALFVLSAPY